MEKRILSSEQFKREEELHREFNGMPGMPALLKTNYKNHSLFLELIDGVTLETFTRSQKPGKALFKKLVILEQVAVALGWMHLEHKGKTATCHRDVTPNNVLIDKDLGVTLIDFGLSSKVSSPPKEFFSVDHPLGTEHFIAPEQLWGDPTPGTATDVFQFGSLVYFVVSHNYPYAKKYGPLLEQMKENERERLLVTGNAILDNVVHACCLLDSRRRPSIFEVRQTLAELLRQNIHDVC